MKSEKLHFVFLERRKLCESMQYMSPSLQALIFLFFEFDTDDGTLKQKRIFIFVEYMSYIYCKV